MAEVLQPPTPTFASRGGTSIKSFKFRERATSSSPPSIGGDSTRRRAFGMSSLLGRRAKNEPPSDLSFAVSEKLLVAEPRASENLDPAVRARNPSRRVTEPAPAATADKKAPAKSRTLLRKITTKFNRNRSRSTSPGSSNRRPSVPIPQVNGTPTGRDAARNAALRARGLLPPLPLSEQEHQQDMRIAIVASPEPGAQSALDRRPTAANRIKEEWEAKNRERLTEFRFGGTSPATSPMQENFPSHALEAVKEVETPLPSPGAYDPPPEFTEAIDELEPKVPRAPPPTLRLGKGHHLAPPLLQTWSDTPPDPYALPLPPSPSPGSAADSKFSSLISAFPTTPLADAQFTPISPSFLPLPPSPSVPDTTFPSIHHGSETPRGTSEAGDCTPRRPASPTMRSTSEGSVSPPSRSKSIPRLDGSESESSLGLPSLMFDSESQTTVSTADSFASYGRMRNVPLATKVRNSTFEPTTHHAISVIVESPGEERDAILSGSPVDEDSGAPKIGEAKALPRRRVTDPVPAPAERRKSLNVFKRGKGEGLSTMMSIRRSMGLGRAKSSAGPRTGFNAAHLPPSPTLPTEFGAQQLAPRGRPAAAGHAHRLSVSPTMHDRGTILFEMNKIEDEESRRMTEVAFM